jgi:hypothetical protein
VNAGVTTVMESEMVVVADKDPEVPAIVIG